MWDWKWRQCPINLKSIDRNLRIQGSGRGTCFVPLVLKYVLIFFKKKENCQEKKNQDLGELPT